MHAENLLSAAFRNTVARPLSRLHNHAVPSRGACHANPGVTPASGLDVLSYLLSWPYVCLPEKKKFCDGRPRLPVFSPTFPYPIHPLLMSFLGQRKKYLHSAVHGKQTGEIMYNIHALKPHHFFRVSYNIKYNTNTKDANEKGCLLKLITQPPPRYFCMSYSFTLAGY